jgi:hypothetical protein
MANISVSDLFSSDSESLMDSISDREGDLIKSAVNRALEARGGLALPSVGIVKQLPPPFPIGIIAVPDIDKYLA